MIWNLTGEKPYAEEEDVQYNGDRAGLCAGGIADPIIYPGSPGRKKVVRDMFCVDGDEGKIENFSFIAINTKHVKGDFSHTRKTRDVSCYQINK